MIVTFSLTSFYILGIIFEAMLVVKELTRVEFV